jgi:hypothetical protein
MRILRLSLIVLTLTATAACHDKDGRNAGKAPPAKPTPPKTELVSLAWTPTDANQNLQSIELQLTGADVVSVCRTPPGWMLKAEGGQVKGYATVGAGFIGVEHLEDLEGLFLIRHHTGEAFGVSGTLLTGVYADDGGQSEIKATPSLLSGRPAEQCPSPRG